MTQRCALRLRAVAVGNVLSLSLESNLSRASHPSSLRRDMNTIYAGDKIRDGSDGGGEG